MKKFGKILGISALTVAAMAVGTLGLSACGEEKKTESTDPSTSQPVTSQSSLIEVFEYMRTDGVSTTMKGFKGVSGDFEISLLPDGVYINAIMISQESGNVVTTYCVDGEVYKQTETQTADEGQEASVEKVKLSAEDAELALSNMQYAYYFATSPTEVDGVDEVLDYARNLEYYLIENFAFILTDPESGHTLTVNKTISGDDVTFNILDKESEDEGTNKEVVIVFEDGQLKSVTSTSTQYVDYEPVESWTYSATAINMIEFPDFSEFEESVGE